MILTILGLYWVNTASINRCLFINIIIILYYYYVQFHYKLIPWLNVGWMKIF